MRVLAIAGSLRRASFNRALLQAAVECAPAGMEIRHLRDLASIPLFNEELEIGGGPDAVALLRRQVAAAEGLLIATPEYNQSIPGVLKNAIDWLSRPAPDEVLVTKAGGRHGRLSRPLGHAPRAGRAASSIQCNGIAGDGQSGTLRARSGKALRCRRPARGSSDARVIARGVDCLREVDRARAVAEAQAASRPHAQCQARAAANDLP